jgi:hypothetical protein
MCKPLIQPINCFKVNLNKNQKYNASVSYFDKNFSVQYFYIQLKEYCTRLEQLNTRMQSNEKFDFKVDYITSFSDLKINDNLEALFYNQKWYRVKVIKIKEDLAELKKSNIELTDQDIADISQLKKIENDLLGLEKSELIDCIQKSNVKMPPNYIDNLKNRKIKVIKYEKSIPGAKRQPRNLKSVLISILKALNENVEKYFQENKILFHEKRHFLILYQLVHLLVNMM